MSSSLRYINARIKNRRDTKANLADTNPLLYSGELILEQDTNKIKMGDGVTLYNELPYIGGNLPTGCVIPFAGTTIPDDWLLCNGQAVSRQEYDDLYAVIGIKYGSGNGSDTFNVPDLRNRFIEGGDTSTCGTKKEAGLPNITGGLCLPTHTGRYSNAVYGAFKDTPWNNGQHGREGADFDEDSYWHDVVEGSFDASRCSSIYGNSNTVQPASYLMCYIIKT